MSILFEFFHTNRAWEPVQACSSRQMDLGCEQISIGFIYGSSRKYCGSGGSQESPCGIPILRGACRLPCSASGVLSQFIRFAGGIPCRLIEVCVAMSSSVIPALMKTNVKLGGILVVFFGLALMSLIGQTNDSSEFLFQQNLLKAKDGEAEAQWAVGCAYELKKDDTNAVKWFRAAASQNYAPAENNLGVYFAEGHGVNQDYAEAVKWYRKAVEQNYAGAQLNLAGCYLTGHGVEKNLAVGLDWTRRAAEQNHPLAQFNLVLLC
jgi:TPR repeat protein